MNGDIKFRAGGFRLGGRIDADTVLIIVMGIAVVLAYILLHLRFAREDVDDAWTLSFIYNMLVRHISPDSTFGGGLASPHIFGMTQAYIYCAILELIGWTKGNSHIVSTFFMAVSSGAWYLILRRINFPVKSALLFALMMLWCDPFFREANLARPESITFFMATISFLFFVYDWTFLSGLFVMIAFENHPMGLFSLVFITSYILGAPKGKFLPVKNFLLPGVLFAAGIAAGAAYYLALHYPYLGEIFSRLRTASASQPFSVLADYFFHFQAKLHIFVFALFILCLVAFLAGKRWGAYPFILYLLALSIIVNFINPRDNYHYTLYFYPSFLLVAFVCLEGTKWRRVAPVALFLIVSLNYMYEMYHNRNFDFSGKITMLRACVPSDTRAVLGGPDEWFAFVGRDFYASTYTHVFDTNRIELYNIEDNYYRNSDNSSGGHREYRAYLKNHYTEKAVTNFIVNDERYDIYLLRKKS
jgi:hypothetical protein